MCIRDRSESPRVQEFCGQVGVYTANFDGCMLGMKATDGSFLKKPWRVVMTLKGLAEKLVQQHALARE
eukprot:8327621-Prorocentrum_lima.AAC.1